MLKYARVPILSLTLFAITANSQSRTSSADSQQGHVITLNILSLDVIKKAQEIQKLAKSVQDKMKYAY